MLRHSALATINCLFATLSHNPQSFHLENERILNKYDTQASTGVNVPLNASEVPLTLSAILISTQGIW
jgi:hypothetical protein